MPLIARLAACLALTASPALAEPAEEEAPNEDADRRFVLAQSEGSLAAPFRLSSEARVSELCKALAGERGKGSQRKERETRRREAELRIYTAMVDPAGFRFGELDPDEPGLPLLLHTALSSMDGVLQLHAVGKDELRFDVDATRAQALVAQAAEKQLRLELIFQVDGGLKGVSPCFGYPRSGSYALSVRALSARIIEGASNKELASARTGAHAALERWLQPGKAVLVLDAQVEGSLDPVVVKGLVEKARPALESCLTPVLSSLGETAFLSYRAEATSAGKLAGVSPEIEAIEHEAAVPCVAEVLAKLTVPRAARASRLGVVVAVVREGEDLEDGEDDEPL